MTFGLPTQSSNCYSHSLRDSGGTIGWSADRTRVHANIGVSCSWSVLPLQSIIVPSEAPPANGATVIRARSRHMSFTALESFSYLLSEVAYIPVVEPQASPVSFLIL